MYVIVYILQGHQLNRRGPIRSINVELLAQKLEEFLKGKDEMDLCDQLLMLVRFLIAHIIPGDPLVARPRCIHYQTKEPCG